MIIGITGGIAAGKSEIGEHLKKKGYYVVCADDVTVSLYKKGSFALSEIENIFGSEVFENGELNRKKLADIVFSSPYELAKLNRLMWDKVKAEVESRIREYYKNFHTSKPVFLTAALLIEAGWTRFMDSVWVVCADEEIRIGRMLKRNNLTREEALKRINSQMNDKDRIEYADIVLYNNGTSKELLTQVDKILSNMI